MRDEGEWGEETGGRTVEEELGTGVVDNEKVNYELSDLHGRYVALPLPVPPHKSTNQYPQAETERTGRTQNLRPPAVP